jgi:uncharacterized protein YgiM (DUF1202 family)
MSENINKISDESLEKVSGGKIRKIDNPDASYANIRSTPGMESRVMFRMNNGELVDTTGLVVNKDGLDWYEIYLDDNVMGWVAGCLIGY